MVETKKRNLKLGLANFFGTLGYFFCSMQWLWAILLYFSLINSAVLFISPNADKPVPIPTPPPTTTVPNTSPLFLLVAAAIVIFMVALTIYAIYKMPSTLAKTSQKAVNVASGNVAHSVLQVQHVKDTQKARKKITPTIIVVLKATLIIIPIVLALASKLLDKQIIDYPVAIFVCLWLAAFSLVAFVLQYLFAKLFTVKWQSLL
jgi:hypothetical protein